MPEESGAEYCRDREVRVGDGKLVVDRPLERAVVAEPRSWLYRVAGLRMRWPGFGAVVLIFLLSRLAFYIATLLGSGLLPQPGQWPGGVQLQSPLPLALHWRWDSIYYYGIAVGGYNFYYSHPVAGSDPSVLSAFFPLLPLLIRATATLLGGLRPPAAVPIEAASWPTLLAGPLVVQAASLLAFWLLFQLAREETNDAATAQRAVLYTAVFPFAFFYAVPYTEALFLAASVGTFLEARRGNWVRAGVWGAAASATRLTGALLLPVLALEIVLAARSGKLHGRDWPRALLGLQLAPLGMLFFVLYLWQRTGAPLAFLQAQQHWQRGEMVLPTTTLWRGIVFAVHPQWFTRSDLYTRDVLETLTVLGFLAVMVASLRRWRPSYVLFGLLLFIVNLSSPLPGQLAMQSQGRYAMALFPVFVTLARWGWRPVVHQAIVLLSLPLFALLAALHVNWWFVA